MRHRHLATVPFANIRSELVRWLWAGRIPLGKISLIEGDGAAGKSTCTTWLGARVSVGDLGGDLIEPADVLMISAEDSAADTIRPRLEAQGANLMRVHQLNGDLAHNFTLPDDMEALRQTIVRQNIKLVVIDPVASFLGPKVSITSDASLRRALGPLKDVAEETGAAIVLVRHLNGQRRAPAYRRGLGGAALANLTRSVLVVALHPDDQGDPNGRRVIALTKGNLSGRATTSLEFHLDQAGRLQIGDEVDLTADELLASQPKAEPRGSRLGEAIGFLRQALAGGPVLVTDLETTARASGIAERTLNRARDVLGVRPRRAGTAWAVSLDWAEPDEPDEPDQLDDPAAPAPPEASRAPAAPNAEPSATRATPLTSIEPNNGQGAPQPTDDAAIRFALIELDGANPASALGTLETPGAFIDFPPWVPTTNGVNAAAEPAP